MNLEIINALEVLFKGLGVGLASSVTVGPVAVLCIQRTLSKTRRAGFISGLGVACADVLMALIAFFFYSMLQAQIDKYRVLLQVIAGIFVVAVGVYVFLQNPAKQIRKNRAGKSDPWQDFSSMFAFTLANFILIIPYLLAFFAMFDVGLDSDSTLMHSNALHCVLVMGGFLCGAVLWWFLVTLLIDLFRKRFRPRPMLTINHVAGVVIGVLGVYTILSTFIDILAVK